MRADSQVYPLVSNANATGAGVPIRGGEYMFTADGTAGASTISLQIQLPACVVRCAMTGGAPSGINATLAGIG